MVGIELGQGLFENNAWRQKGCSKCGMKKQLMDILVCPVCKSKLELTVEKEEAQEVVTGSLFCQRCNLRYPITDSIPNLLPPEGR